MSKFVISNFKVLAVGLAMAVTSSAHAAVKHQSSTAVRAKLENIVLWCGATSANEKEKFPYLTAIKNYKLKNGHPVQVATVYEKGKLIMRQYVYRHPTTHAVSYEAPDGSGGDVFSLNLRNDHGLSSWAEFKAVVHDGDGTKLIGNGAIPCYLHGKRS